MTIARTSIREFSVDRPWYAEYQVYAYTIDETTGLATSTLATLYAAPTGSTTLANPQRLTSTGSFAQPVYIEEPVALVEYNVGTGQSRSTGTVGLGIVGSSVQDAQTAANAALAYAELARRYSRIARQYGPTISAFMLTLLDDGDAATALATLGIALDFQATYTDVKVGSTVVSRHTKATSQVNYPNLTGSAAAGVVSYGAAGSDTNIGVAVSSKGTDPVQIFNGSYEAARFTQAATPVNYLDFYSAGTNGPVVVGAAGSDSNISVKLVPKGTGSVLIGYSFKITNAGPSNTPQIQVVGDATNEAVISLNEFTASPSGLGAAVVLGRSRNATAGSHTILQNSDSIGGIFWEASDGVDFCPAAAIRAYISGTPGSDDMPTQLAFGTTPDGGSSIVNSWYVQPTGDLIPAADNTYQLGNASFGVKEIFADNGTINTSDGRQKIAAQPTELGLDFINRLQPKRFKWDDYDIPAVTEKRTVKRKKTKLESRTVLERVVETGPDGSPIAKIKEVTREERIVVTQRMPVMGVDGNWLTEKKPLFDALGNVVGAKTVPVYHDEPIYEDVEETVVLKPARNGTFKRFHDGFMAQDVKQALIDSGADPTDTRGMYVYDAKADKHALRYSEMIAPMVRAIQELSSENDVVKAENAMLKARLDAIEARLPTP